jgi:hypothetical protein
MVFLKIVLDTFGTLSYISPVPSGWDGSGACGRGHANPGLGRPKADSGVPRVLRPPPSDPTAPYYGGAAMRLEADREKAGASDLCKGRKLWQARSGFGDPTADKNWRTLVRNRRAGRQETGT